MLADTQRCDQVLEEVSSDTHLLNKVDPPAPSIMQ